jgi:hypothetical protein
MIYGLMELIRVRKILNWQPWFYLKAVFVILGALAAVPAAISGLLVIQEFAVTPQATAILTKHTLSAYASILSFLPLAIVYAIAWRKGTKPGRWTIILALIGLFFLTVTGALGGGFVHGSGVDPMVQFVFKMLGL